MRSIITSVCLIFYLSAPGQTRVLHYTETSGFDHNTRTQSLALLDSIGGLLGFDVTDDPSGVKFDHPDTLAQFDLIIFSNTSGDQLLNASQRASFEQYIANGGSLLGIHAASDTYRHSTSNGNSTGTWDFYAETLGGSVQQSPNHVSGTPVYDMFQPISHPSTQGIPDPWTKGEEYYYWENGFFDSTNTVVLMVEATTGQGSTGGTWDSSRAVSWVRILPQGGKVFYTSLGHRATDFSSDALFQQHILQGIQWILTSNMGLEKDHVQPMFRLKNNILISSEPMYELEIHDLNGRTLYQLHPFYPFIKIKIPDQITGLHILRVRTHSGWKTLKIIR